MCGFCVEGAMTLSFLESEILNTEFVMQNGWTPIYIQEANDLIEILKRIKNTTGFSNSIDVALCRLYEVYILKGFQCSLFDYIVSIYQEDEIAEFFVDRAESWAKTPSSLIFQDFLSRFCNQDIYRNKTAWEDFTNDTDRLVKESESLLKNYCNWWLLEKDEENTDSIDDTPPSESKQFDVIFPVLYFAFSVLRRYRPNSEVIKFIALNCSKNTPDFFGYDLWLQRKAFLVCIQEYGVLFIVENLKKIRLELIAYAVLKQEMTTEDREIIKYLMSNYEYGVIGLEPDNITQLINDVQAQEMLRQNTTLD